MEHNRPRLLTTEKKEKSSILIVDKKGTIGEKLAEKLQTQFLVVLVSGKNVLSSSNVVQIAYPKKIPLIPDYTYAPIFWVYSGDESELLALPALVKKAKESHTQVFILLPINESRPELIKQLKAFETLHVMLIGELFDNQTSEQNTLTYFISQARNAGRIELSHSGLAKLHPVLFEEAILAILSVAFATEHNHMIHLIFPAHSFSEFTVARLLQKIEPDIRVDFRKQKTSLPSSYIPPEGRSVFVQYDLESKLRTIDLARIHHPAQQLRTRTKKITPPVFHKEKSPVMLVLWTVLLIMILPIGLVGLSFSIGVFALQQAVIDAQKAQFVSAKQKAHIAESSFVVSEVFSPGLWPMSWAASTQHHIVLYAIQTGRQVSETSTTLFDAAHLLQNVFSGESIDPKADFLRATAELKNSLVSLQKMQAQGTLPQAIEENVTSLAPLLTVVENTIDTWPTIFGLEGKKTYMILFQNNMELRPGGGFIGSYGLVTLENGQLVDFTIHDVYEADGQLAKHVEPPFAFRRYMGAAHWFLRDSNYAIDFPQNGATAAQFLQLETGENVDGVIGIDTYFLKNILSAVGPVAVPDYNEKVTADNVYPLTQKYVEKDFFPGSKQKKDFLQSVANGITQKLATEQVPYKALVAALGNSLAEKHVLFYFTDPTIQTVYTVNNVSSSLWDGRTQGQDMLLDYLGVIDTNVGGNKANYYVKRILDHAVKLTTTGEVQGIVSATYTNASTNESAFGGDYQNYVQFLLPKGAIVDTVLIDGKTVQATVAITDPKVYTEGNFKPPTQLEIEKSRQGEKEVVGMFVVVSKGSKKELSLGYHIPKAFSPSAPSFTYDVRLFKQPGTDADPYTFTLSYPSSLTPVVFTGGVNLGGKLQFEGKLDKDRSLQVVLSQKN